ncbi:MAG TPA: hypothetical protein VGG08_06405 [Solirubrobacteraceae bacterium]|jgi:hypothetical protein
MWEESTIGRGTATAACVLVAASALLWGVGSSVADAAAVSSADSTATSTYLEARYELLRATVQDVDATAAAEAKASQAFGQECAGALHGAPDSEFEFVPLPTTRPTPRAEGESRRAEQQKDVLLGELAGNLASASAQPSRSAIESFVATVSPLRWSNALIAELIASEAGELEQTLNSPQSPACADMRFWAQSGFRRLSPDSKAFETTRAARLQTLQEGNLLDLLKPLEDSEARRLVARTRALEVKRTHLRIAAELPSEEALDKALGLPASPFAVNKKPPQIAHGKTLSGAEYVLRKAGHEGGCRHTISVTFEESSEGGSSSSTSELCVRRKPTSLPESGCSGGKLATIENGVEPSVRSVRIQLNDGRTIAARVIQLSRRDGGPGGVFVQSFLGRRNLRVLAIVERDAAGGVVLRLAPKHMTPCREDLEPGKPTFAPLAQGSTPGGEGFTIEGVFYSFGKHQEFNFEVDTNEGSGYDHPNVISRGSDEGPAKPKAYGWSLRNECEPNPYAIVYGALTAPGASVEARTPQGLVALTKVAIPAKLHAPGPLLYGAFAEVPSELVVLRADGSVLYTESLATQDKDQTEYCEGYVEPPA